MVCAVTDYLYIEPSRARHCMFLQSGPVEFRTGKELEQDCICILFDTIPMEMKSHMC